MPSPKVAACAATLGKRPQKGFLVMGNKKSKIGVKVKAASKPQVTTARSRSGGDGFIYVAKLGATPVKVASTRPMKVYDVLKQAQFAAGEIVDGRGVAITNLIDAAEAEVSSGRASNVGNVLTDIRVDAEPAALDTMAQPGSKITLVPMIKGG